MKAAASKPALSFFISVVNLPVMLNLSRQKWTGNMHIYVAHVVKALKPDASNAQISTGKCKAWRKLYDAAGSHQSRIEGSTNNTTSGPSRGIEPIP
jgi:hypothetical protein